MSRSLHRILLLSLIGAAAYACDDSAQRQVHDKALIQTRLQERLETGRAVRREACMRRLADSALYIVDSIRLEEARWALDTIRGRPHKPFKPDNPGPGASIDSLEIKPLLPDSVKRKSN